MKRRRSGPSLNTGSKYLFGSSFEEKKILGYARNLISSKFLYYRTEELYRLATDILGKGMMGAFLKKKYPDIANDEKFGQWIEYNRLVDNIPSEVVMRFLKENVCRMLSARLAEITYADDPDLEERLDILKKTFGLKSEEVEVIIFFYLKETSQLVQSYLDSPSIADFSFLSTLRSHGHIVLGLDRVTFISVLSNSILYDTDILDVSHRVTLSSWCTEYLSGARKKALKHEFFSKENNETLNISDFDLPEDELIVLSELSGREEGFNVLFYGVPGAGKTSLARSIAKKFKKELLTVKIPERDKQEGRFRAIYATINLADRNNSIILIDEADEILNSFNSLFFESKINKSWINNLLDNHQKKVIWVTNRSEQIDPSTMRRFTFSMEFRKFDAKKRLRIIKHELVSKGLGGYFEEKDLEDICRNYSVNADGIIKALNIINIKREADKETALRKLKVVLKNHEIVTSGRVKRAEKIRDFESYSCTGLNTSINLEGIISSVRQFAEMKGKDSIASRNSITMLFHGMPGTGKTEFVYYLAGILKKEVLLKRCSEIQSMWVGETEKNIAAAFREAQESDNILLFDEADSFLYPRSHAGRSWEKNFTNEILTQLENFNGIVVFATNDIEGLDHAALRRFKFKIEFMPLTPKGNLEFYNLLLKPLVAEGQEITQEDEKRIMEIKNLTPGDFVVVRDQLAFEERSLITHRRMTEMLMNEVRYKQGEKHAIGF